MNTEHELFGELHEQEENGLFGNEHRRQYEAQQETLRLIAQMMNKERIVESNVEPAIVGNTLLGAVHSCSRCKWLYWNEGENQFDCGLGYLGKAVKDDLQEKNDCNDFEHYT
jgi:hypothetical protein